MSAVIESLDLTGLVENLPEETYHRHAALSASGMKVLLRSPKHFDLSRRRRVERAEFDIGHAIHAAVLGVGMDVIEIPEDILGANGALSTKAAKDFVAEARSNGLIPLKAATITEVQSAADAVMSNEKARDLLERPGLTEVSLFAKDPYTGVPLRGRLDRLADVLIDLKSTADVRVEKITRSVTDYGYDLSAAVYRSLVEAVTGDDPGPMHLIFVEKEPPYEVRVVTLSHPDWHEAGQRKMRAAIDMFAWCSERNVWPGDDEDGGPIQELEPPAWYLNAVVKELS
ncbi:PD-(D/E)XK nuclease-like domain-containing protein [uncultured Microbacterium sp.]|uniref:PD-(D/E)XK nuclease-like domain-containing protein n=1 Tax=uncultured Microbacterium sp. TaxID=191216 RepID=UPI0025F703DC|nr:PD-(D/E)XK nuclease-like domain-containing protein [uncultured Microbacterium sp.]